MEVKIGSGIWRGRRLMTPGGATHPMGAREKLALFNIIAERLPGARVLDAYAGSGALGLEALSRGAETVVFVEQNPKAARIIHENLRSLGATGCVVISDVGKFACGLPFDVVIADPPYDDFQVAEVAHLTDFVKNGGVLVLSHPGEAPVLQGLALDKTRKYAGASLSFYTK